MQDGFVDLNNLKFETYKKRIIFKVIRDGNEQPNKR